MLVVSSIDSFSLSSTCSHALIIVATCLFIVFVQVRIAVQYRVLLESAYDAYYRLSDPRGQIQSYVFDVVRSTVPKMELDEAFASKQDIADATLLQLKDVMQDYVSVFEICLVTVLYKEMVWVYSLPYRRL